MKFYNKGIAAHLEAILKLLDDDHLVFENLQGQGPIDLITVNKETGKFGKRRRCEDILFLLIIRGISLSVKFKSVCQKNFMH